VLHFLGIFKERAILQNGALSIEGATHSVESVPQVHGALSIEHYMDNHACAVR